MVSERACQRAFFGVSALLFFAASAAVTIVWCASMSAMGERCGCPDRRGPAPRRRCSAYVGRDDDGSDAAAAILGANAVALPPGRTTG